MRDALKSYLALAGGVTQLTRRRALAAARALVSQGEATAEQVTALAEDLLAQTRQNREAVAALVAFEVDRALGRLGLATADEVTALTGRVRDLERELRELRRAGSGSPDAPAQKAAGGATEQANKAPAAKTSADKPATTTTTAAKKAPAKKSADKKAPAKNTPAKAATAKRAPAEGPTDTTAAAHKAPATQAPAKKAPQARAPESKDAGVQQDLLAPVDSAPEQGESPA